VHKDPLFTAEARRHSARLRHALAPLVGALDRRFSRWLRERKYDDVVRRALLAITPAAAARLRTLDQFLEQAEYNGRRLAKCNMEPGEVHAALREFGAWVEAAVAGQFAPPREQLYLATVLALDRGYYQVREAEAQTLFGIYRAEAESTDPAELLRRLVEILSRSFRTRAARWFVSETPLERPLLRPLYIEAGGAKGRFIADPEMRGRYASYWSYPLGGSAVIQLAFATPYPWLPRELNLLEAAAERYRKALERAALETELRRLEAESRQAEELERRRIGRELHDETGQLLMLLRLQLEMMERRAEGGMRAELVEARGIVERAVTDLRRIIAALSPAVLERLGLIPALRQLAGRAERFGRMRARLHVQGAPEGLPRRTQEVIYRVAQESLQNIVKHSQATHVNLSLHTADKFIRLQIADDGIGFLSDPAANKPMSFGLAGMRERAALLGGTLRIRSKEGKGTRIVVELPLETGLVKRNGKDSRAVD
jgi:signal transduction histidine kinase